MKTIQASELHEKLQDCEEVEHVKVIVASSHMSDDRIGGDDVVSFVDDTLEAIKEGWTIFTWYGPNAEALIVGYKPDQIKIV